MFPSSLRKLFPSMNMCLIADSWELLLKCIWKYISFLKELVSKCQWREEGNNTVPWEKAFFTGIHVCANMSFGQTHTGTALVPLFPNATDSAPFIWIILGCHVLQWDSENVNWSMTGQNHSEDKQLSPDVLECY